MAITDNKVTATPLTVGVGSAGDLLTGSTPAELAANKAIFDAFPDAIKSKHDDLIDYIDIKPLSFTSTVAAATANKGTFSGWVPTGAIIDLIMTNGNTAAAPTITIDSVAYTITGMPTTAKVSTSTAQAYKLKKTGADTLAFVNLPDYVCEFGTSGKFEYERKASGKATLYMNSSESTGALTMTQISTSGTYVSQNITLALPSGLFASAGYTANPSIFSSSYVIGFLEQYSASSGNSLVFKVEKSGSSDADVSYRYSVFGRWF